MQPLPASWAVRIPFWNRFVSLELRQEPDELNL